ncbi:flavodoxin domain-containing protein [Streptomyces sp. VRA16 Mangrove soil]|uniref:flavodoxin domain-containing protein n=1 Tax=Streptomyces sp. VRA16 Mangrove soil TaxID=2817434 RepID=UPI001A9E0181|nr:flavodoxin domain-containing protein [Streptomyces sp. VRA16 Mangrove soil]MBO1333028.1 flavodoxin [Streptomyces sp. VRA16 Mangrove soil]
MPVLVAYASAHGSTREVAEHIAARLGRRGLDAVTAPLDTDPDPCPWQAVVLGSAVHDGAWLPPAEAYVRRRGAALRGRPVWMFSVGMSAALPRPLRRLASRAEQPPIARLVTVVRPREHRRFSGVIRRDQLDRRGRVVFRLLGCRYGDHRDWPGIDAWADAVAAHLTGTDTTTGRRTP